MEARKRENKKRNRDDEGKEGVPAKSIIVIPVCSHYPDVC